MTTTVINIKDAPDDWEDDPQYVYIGREVPRHKVRGSKWGNPFVIGTHGTRAQVVRQYALWLQSQPQLIADLPDLRGKTLVCWCKPEACHGDVLSEWADKE